MKVAFHTLGCKVNQYETQAMTEQFKARGFEVVSEESFADAYVVNTCSVTNLADRKSRQYIRRMKKVNPESVMAVTGCYAQMAGEEIIDIPEVDIVMGMNEKHLIVDQVVRQLAAKGADGTKGAVAGAGSNAHGQAGQGDKYIHVLPYEELDRYVETGQIVSMESRTRAYIKVQEGCNRFCSYCIIPYARGQVRSRGVSDVVAEAKGLIDAGFKELILTGINTALYGMEKGFDFEHQPGEEDLKGIEILISRISQLPGDFRIRLSSLEPTVIDKDYVKRLFGYPKLCHHLHLSIQSGSDRVLGGMNRHYTQSEYLDIVRALKDFDPLYGITTDIIVGFPGEADQDFEESIKVVKQAGFCKVHVFQYSKRPGTKACQMSGHVEGPVKKARSERLLEVAEEETREFLRANIGTVQKVLFEEESKDGSHMVGYSDNYIRVYVERSAFGGAGQSGEAAGFGAATAAGDFGYVKIDEIYKDGVKGHIVI